jgi:outer membrane protein assembly factor BamE
MLIRFFYRGVPLGLVVLIAACSALTPYKLPIQQGNIVSSESLAKLKSGMSKNQAAQALGTPLVNDIFHANRWDYVHYLSKRGTMSEKNHVALIFEEERLARLVGEGVPALLPMAEQADPVVEPDAKEPTETK